MIYGVTNGMTVEADETSIDMLERYVFLKKWGWSYKSYIETPPMVRRELLFIDNEFKDVQQHLSKVQQFLNERK